MNYMSCSIILFINLLNILCSQFGTVKGIRSGQYVQDGQFIYHVSVLINDQHACGGSILDNKHILTAGQCVLDANGYFLDVKFEVLAGVNYLDSRAFSRLKIKVAYIYVKFEFRPPERPRPSLSNSLEIADIAVLKLAESLRLGQNSVLQMVFMPLKVRGMYQKFNYKKANLSGFGQSSPMNYQSSSDIGNLLLRRNSAKMLKYTTVRIERKDFCKRAYKRGFGDTHICAVSLSDTPKGVCLGDVGGSLIFENTYVIGVLSVYNKNCDDTEKPAVYTRISPFTDFIEAALLDNFLIDMRLANYTGSHVYEIFHPSILS